MFRGLFEGWTPVIIIVVIVLLFGAPKLPGLARSLGQSLRIFRGEMKQMKDDKNAETGKGADKVSRSTTARAGSTKTGTAKSVAAPAAVKRAAGSSSSRSASRSSTASRKPSAK